LDEEAGTLVFQQKKKEKKKNFAKHLPRWGKMGTYLHGTTLTHISVSFPMKGVIPPGVKGGDVLQDNIPFGNGRVIIPIPNSASNDFSSWKGEAIDGRIKAHHSVGKTDNLC